METQTHSEPNQASKTSTKPTNYTARPAFYIALALAAILASLLSLNPSMCSYKKPKMQVVDLQLEIPSHIRIISNKGTIQTLQVIQTPQGASTASPYSPPSNWCQPNSFSSSQPPQETPNNDTVP